MERSKGSIIIPEELQNVLEDESEAREFFESLTDMVISEDTVIG